MKSVMLSIQPKWCEKILSGKMEIIPLKTRPLLATPFKCYIYENGGIKYGLHRPFGTPYGYEGKQKVIAEFICDEIIKVEGYSELGWHISYLKIYDKPRELSEFKPFCNHRIEDDCYSWKVECEHRKFDRNPDGSLNVVICNQKMTKPHKSWGYVESEEY